MSFVKSLFHRFYPFSIALTAVLILNLISPPQMNADENLGEIPSETGSPVRIQNTGKDVTFDFDEIDIRSFIKIVSELTGENYVIDPAVNGKITVSSPKPIPHEAVPVVFQSVLDVYGYVAVADGDIVKIIPFTRAREGGGVITPGDQARSDAVVTRIFQLGHADVNDVRNVIRPLLSRSGNVTAHAGSRTLLVTDFAGNVNRLQGIIDIIDGTGPRLQQKVLPLTYADADAVASAVTALYAAQPPESGIRPVVIPERRSNSLLIHAGQDDMQGVLNLIGELDVARVEERTSLKVIRLRYADAESTARLLTTQFLPGDTDGRAGRSAGAMGGGTDAIIVNADVYSNSIVVSASPERIAAVEQVIGELDIPRRQILVEALIVEMSSDLTHELGMEWRLTDAIRDDGYTTIGGTSLSTSGTSAMQSTAANPLALPPGLAIGIVDGTISWGGTTIANIGALARAMQATSGVNVLSTPHLLALDNEEAEIIVGEERPFLTGSQTTDSNSVIRTYEFKDIGLVLRVTPRTTDDGQVVLKLFQEIRSFLAESDIGAVTTSKRQTKTTIRVGGGQMVAIGGLLKEDQRDLTSSVPCLGAIPLMGHLFKAVNTRTTKTNLLIFMTPTIIPDANTLEEASQKYIDRMESEPTPKPAIDIPIP
ncbi:MAG: type II secretion system secretin GspD [bacterium]